MNNYKILSYAIFFFALCFSCDNSVHKKDDGLSLSYYPNGAVSALYNIAKGEKNGDYFIFYEDGKLKEKGFWKNDTILLSEQIKYYNSGVISEYNFYNFIGERRFTRTFDSSGIIKENKGDFLAYAEINSAEISLGDSVVLKIYVASPPGIVHEVYGLTNGKRFKTFKRTKYPYMYIWKRKMKKTGDFLVMYEVDFRDSINKIHEIRKDEVSFKVTNTK